MVVKTKEDFSIEDYFKNNYSYNELLKNDGTLRPNWETFFQSFQQLGKQEIQNRNSDLARLMKENGVTYNIYGTPDGLNRPWKLDLIPFLISKDEWVTIESGLTQRATLLDLILKDIYGEQQLIKKGLLPLELIYRHAGFLRQCVGIKPPGKHSLIVYSADMARSPDGKIWVVNDRTQAPSGAGYALENRTAISHIVPELFNGLKVRHLSPWFGALTNGLYQIAPHQNSNPRVVILTPGPSNETYFEHSYLSSYLGFTLVQGNDLMVKDNFVWLKTLGGLEKVDVILRRVDDVYCDPLELRTDSQLGVAGLLQVVRSGNVQIANPLGSSILENPGLIPFLPSIARFFLGKELILPTIASWWCGQEKELKYVLNNVEKLIIKRIYRDSLASTSVDGAMLSQKELTNLKNEIKAHPYFYVGQEKLNFSTTPSLNFKSGKVEPRNALFRSFLVSNNQEYVAMAGGLTRTSAESGKFVISNQLGGISKDTWIISPEPDKVLKVKREKKIIIPTTNTNELPSQTAENLFWVGRYTERVLGNARFQRTVMKFLADGNRIISENDTITDEQLLKTLTAYTFTYPGFHNQENPLVLKQPWTELKEILLNETRNGSLRNNFILFRNAAHNSQIHLF